MNHPQPLAQRSRRGFSLIEMTVAVLVLSLITAVLGGLAAAVASTREHVEGLKAATGQGEAALDRMRRAVAGAGVYKVGNGPTVAGILVVENRYGSVNLPDTLVVWTGGRESSLADRGVLTGLPDAKQVLAFTPDPAAPGQLLEVTWPLALPIDFTDPAFPQMVRDAVRSSLAPRLILCDRVRVGPVGPGKSNPATAVRFQVTATPWKAGLSSSSVDLRQIVVQMELQMRTSDRPGAVALPLYASAVRRYEHRVAP